MGFKLYEIKADYDILIQAALRTAEENDGVIPDDLSNKIDMLEGTLTDKAVSVGHIIKNARAEAEAIGNEIEALQARKHTADGLAESLKDYLARNIPAGMKIETPTVAIGWRASSEVVVDNMEQVPVEYQRVTIEARRVDIKAAWKQGKEIPGCHEQKNQNIQVR